MGFLISRGKKRYIAYCITSVLLRFEIFFKLGFRDIMLVAFPVSGIFRTFQSLASKCSNVGPNFCPLHMADYSLRGWFIV